CASPISAEKLVNKCFDSRAGASVTLDIGRPEERHAEQRSAQMTVQRVKLAGVAIACFAFLAAAPGAALAQSKCTGKEIGAAGKKAGGKAKCWSKATKKGLAVDSACLSGAETKFSASYMNAQSKMDCVNGTAEGTIETKVDNLAADVNSELTAAGATTTTTMTGSTTTSTMGGTCAPIVIGQPIAGTYVVNGTTGEFRCTTNSSTNRFGTCTDDAQCGGTAGMHTMCLQLPWVTADGQVMPFPSTVQTVFTVGAAGSFPTCAHGVCVPCGDPHA